MNFVWIVFMALFFVGCTGNPKPETVNPQPNNTVYKKQESDDQLSSAVEKVKNTLNFMVRIADSDIIYQDKTDKDGLIDEAVKSLDNVIIQTPDMAEYPIKDYLMQLAKLSYKGKYSRVKLTYDPDSIRLIENSYNEKIYNLTYKVHGELEVCEPLIMEKCDKKRKDTNLMLTIKNPNSTSAVITINGITENGS